jgi:hypothetical protein
LQKHTGYNNITIIRRRIIKKLSKSAIANLL